jgi:hypothetical protein
LAAALLCCASLAPLAAGADPWEARREVREGARKEIHAARAHGHWPPGHYVRHSPYYYVSSPYYRDGRYYGSNVWDGVAHYHPDGHYCREARHVVHYRDGYYRTSGRWYRDGRYWNEPDYVNRYYRHHHDDDDNDDLLRGIVIGAAVVGVIAAVHEANDGD